MSQNMFKYEALVEYFTDEEDGGKNEYDDAFPGRHGKSGET